MIRALSLVALSALIFVAYAPVRDARFLNYDDNEYVYANPQVVRGLSAEGLAWAFTESHSSNWHPLTWIAHMLDVEFFGARQEDAGKHHLSNVLVHAIASMLLAWLGFALTGRWWASLFVAALFALHPLHVESVAWISERKDTLSAALGFATLISWVGWVRHGGRGRYLRTSALFAAGLMAKPMLVTLPAIMLVLDAWPLRREIGLVGRLREKAPWFALALLSGIATILAQQSGQAVRSTIAVPLADRFLNAIHAIVTYLGKLVAPLDLSVIYPHWATTPNLSRPPVLQTVVEAALIAAISLAAWWAWRRRGERLPLAAWSMWLILLAPVIGIVQVGDQSMADRYTYLPAIALFGLATAGLVRLTDQDARARTPVVLLAALLLVACSVGTWRRAQDWRDSETLFEAAVEVEPLSALAHLNLGEALARRDETEKAARHYEMAIRLRPGDPSAYFNYANSLRDLGRLEESLAVYAMALQADPAYAAAANNLGDALARLGRYEEAVVQFERAIRLDPALAAAQANLARALLLLGRPGDALAPARAAVRLDPESPAHRQVLAQVEAAGG